MTFRPGINFIPIPAADQVVVTTMQKMPDTHYN